MTRRSRSPKRGRTPGRDRGDDAAGDGLRPRVRSARQSCDVAFQLPVTIRRLLVQIPDKQLAASVRRIDLIPRAVVPPADREDVPVRTVETLPERAGAYLVYTDEHAYPENGIFWSRGTEETHVMIAAAGITRLTLTLSTGPMAGDGRCLCLWPEENRHHACGRDSGRIIRSGAHNAAAHPGHRAIVGDVSSGGDGQGLDGHARPGMPGENRT